MYYDRITEWFELEGTLKIIMFQPSYQGQRHLPLDQVARRLTQPGLEHSQEGGRCNFSGQPIPVFYHPHNKKILPHI